MQGPKTLQSEKNPDCIHMAATGRAEIPFVPSWWCPGHHFQTIYNYFFRPHEKVPLRGERIETPDGDFLDLDFLDGNQEAPLILILHGLEGSSRKAYIQGFLTALWRIGWRACVMHYRGCSGEPNRLKTSYHLGKTDDVDQTVQLLASREAPKKIMMVGYSMGGNVLLKWLGERGAAASGWVEKAVSASAPYDLVKAVDIMDHGFNREVYTRKLLFTMRRKILAKERIWPGLVNRRRTWFANTFRKFDAEVTVPLFGFKSVHDYWDQSSCIHYLSDIRVETALVHSADDPFYPGRYFQSDAVRKSEFLQAYWTRYGGHMGFVQGPWPWKQVPWLENTIIDFFSRSR